MSLPNTGDLNTFGKQSQQFGDCAAVGWQSLHSYFGPVKASRLWWEDWLHLTGQKVEAKNRADYAERIGNGVANRRRLGAHDVERRLQRCRARHRPSEDAKGVA